MRPDWQRLERLLREPPIPQLAALSQDGHRLALVGGAIRDTLMGRTPRDIDLIVEGDLNAVIDALEQARGRRPTSIGDGFQNTHRFRWRGTSVDIAESIGTLSEDLSRRDFTINAMAVRLPAGGEAQEALVDPHHGLAHLEAKRIVPCPRPLSPRIPCV